MNSVMIFLIATAIFCLSVVGNPRRGYYFFDTSEDGDAFIHLPWGRNTKKPDIPKPHKPAQNGLFGSSESSDEGTHTSLKSGHGTEGGWQNREDGFLLAPSSTIENPNPMSSETKACIESCPSTSEYNPVCGSNKVTYRNPGLLDCAQKCGVAVRLNKLTACPISKTINTQRTKTKEELLACIRQCPKTAEYNPVCGSNNETYSNPEHLDCAQICGVEVHISRQTSCDAPTPEEDIKNSTPLSITNNTIAQAFIDENGGNNSDRENNGTKQNNNSGNNTENQVGKGGNNLSSGKNHDEETILNRDTDGNNAENIFNGENNRNLVHQEKRGYHSGAGSSDFRRNNANCGNRFNGRRGNNIRNNADNPRNNCNGINNSNKKRTPTEKELIECMQLCVLTSEFNPVCGTDDITYMNPGRLLCAQLCGSEVRVKKFAVCSSTSTCNYNDYPAPCTNPPVNSNPGEVIPPNSLRSCLKACPTTNLSRPVCGTNNVTYRNIEKLQCARRCGVDVSLRKDTHCSAPDRNDANGNPPVLGSTEKPTLQKCIQECTVQQTQDPICGTDNVTYNNTGHLICARQCGLDVEVKLLSRCPSINPSTEKREVTPATAPDQSGLHFTIPPDVISTIWAKKPKDDEDFELDPRFLAHN